jgi:DeoR family transcriptional regulator, fructose operon transcriptional repressor
MLGEERLAQLHKMILANKSVTIDELSRSFQVTPMTIRRDLDKLCENYPIIKRCHGGVIVATEVNIEENLEIKRTMNTQEKQSIAQRAFQEISNNDTIYLDAGSTVSELAKLIADSDLRLTILTNDIEIARILRNSSSEVILTGGVIQKSTGCLIGSLAEEMLNKIKLKIAFMGATAINENFEVLTPSIEKRSMKPKIIENAMKSYLLVDKDKFNKYSTYVIYSLKDFTGVITDKEFVDAEKAILMQQEINIVY